MKILVTGANGFVGSIIIPRLLEEGHTVVALVRKKNKEKRIEGLSYVEGDLLKPKSLPDIGKVDKAFYLVHGLKEEQSDFEYYESLAAVNFINWMRPSAPDVIYLGAIVPKEEELSPHLRSRKLTGAILGASGLNVLEFRASIVLGEGSLSFEMIKAIAERMPFRPEMNLLSQKCQPLSMNDLIKYLVAALEYAFKQHEIIEIGGTEVVDYGDLLDIYSDLNGLKRKRIKVPDVEKRVLMKLLDYAIPEFSSIGKKLTESMSHETILKDDLAKKIFPKVRPKAVKVAMDMARTNSKTTYPPIWGKDFLKTLLSDKLLVQSGLLSPDILKHLEKVTKLKEILSRSKS